MTNHLEIHAGQIASMVEEIEELPDSELKLKTLSLIEGIDHLHRSCIWRLFELVTELGGKGLVDRLSSDPAVKMLFVLYDLIPTEPLRPVETQVPVIASNSGGFIPLASLKRSASWAVAFDSEDLPAGSVHGIEIDLTPVLLVSTDAGTHAYRNACPGSVLPLHLGTLRDGILHCPWHGCRYEAATGRSLQEGQEGQQGKGGLESFDVRVETGRIWVATNRASGQG